MLTLLRAADYLYNGNLHQFPAQPAFIFLQSLLNDLVFFFKINLLLAALFVALYLVNKRLAFGVTIGLTILATLVTMGLMQYFTLSFVPLGADLYGSSLQDIKQTAGASGGISIGLIAVLGAAVFGLLAVYKWISPAFKGAAKWINLAASVVAIAWIITLAFTHNKFTIKDGYADNLAKNKLDYFVTASFNHFFPAGTETLNNGPAADKRFACTDETNYPLLHTDSTADVLTPFFNKDTTKPNIVVLLVEGLGRAFTNDNAYLGSFTPYLDSLSRQSLYWENFFSNSGRTFASLPSLLGSLPSGASGFNELGDQMPNHLSLMSILKSNGYRTSFFYGGDAGFDNMALFLKKQKVDSVYDIKSFPATFQKLPENNGFTWGYGDKELYRHVLNQYDLQSTGQPSLQVILTVSTHNPFLVNDQQHYLEAFEIRMNALRFSEVQKAEHRRYSKQYASILYADDAIQSFINNYRSRPGFSNTIFIITGDHRMPEIPMSTKIDRYHVPLIIYSPLLKHPQKFESVSLHIDVAPSLLAYLKNSYHLQSPGLVTWVGSGLDTAHEFRNIHASAIKQTKSNLVDFVMGNYHLNDANLFKLSKNMDEELDTNPV